MKTFKILSMAVTIAILFVSCSNDNDSQPVNEEEVITTVTATLTPVGGGTAVVLQSKDLDGDGPTAPVVTVSGNFAKGKTYNGALSLLNELSNPVGNTSAEILEEGVDHQFFFQSTGGTFASSAYLDTDANGAPIGLQFSLTAGATASTGNLTITLRHQPNKSGINVPAGDITNANGETDVQVTFPVVVE